MARPDAQECTCTPYWPSEVHQRAKWPKCTSAYVVIKPMQQYVQYMYPINIFSERVFEPNVHSNAVRWGRVEKMESHHLWEGTC